MRPIISTRELADAIDVSESSLKRWADEGLIEVSRTAGGHRRIAIGEAIRFIRATRSPVVRPDVLGLTDLSPGGEHVVSPESPADRLYAHLRDGRAREARGLILSQYLAGQSVGQIADGPIHAAMARLGELWMHDRAGVYIEHRAVDICVQGVQQLRQFVEPGESGDLAMGGGPPGDPYILPSLLSATALAADGWRTMNLGPDTPFESLSIAADRHGPRLVWLCVSSVRDAREMERAIERISTSLQQRGAMLVVGGRASDTLALESMPLRRGNSISSLVTIAAELKSNPSESTASGSPAVPA